MADTLNLNPTITTAGRNLIPTGSLPGFNVVLTHISIGTGQWDPTAVVGGSTAGANATALVAEVARYAITSGTKPSPNSLQIGTTITDTDSFGASPNGKSIGEIGFWAGTTLFAVWSRLGDFLFVKSPQFDVPFAYTLDQSILPQASVSVSVTTDPAGMAALILQHSAQANPHLVYVTQLRGMGDYDPLLIYPIGAHVIASDGKTYRGLVANNVGNAPQLFPLKWERWGHSVTELGQEFVPARTAISSGVQDATGVAILRIENPDLAFYAGVGAVTGALKIAFPAATKTLDAFVTIRLEVFDESSRGSFTALLSGRVTNMVWEATTQAVILSGLVGRDLGIRFGNDGASASIWIGELAATWTAPRVHVKELTVSLTGANAGAAAWSSGWAITLVQAFGAIGQSMTGNLVFGQSSVAKVAGLQAALDAKVNLVGSSEITGNVGITGALAIRNGNSIALQSTGGTYSAYLRSDPSGQSGFLNQAQNAWNFLLSDAGVLNLPRARPTWANCSPWDNGNLPSPAQTTGMSMTGNIALTNSTFLIMQSGGYTAYLRADSTGVVGFLNQALNRFNLTLSDAGNLSIAGTANFGLRPTWQGFVPWDTGNFNPAAYAPVRVANANFGYVGSNTPNGIIVNWSGGMQAFVDGQYQGNLVTIGGGANPINAYAADRNATCQWNTGTVEVGPFSNGLIGNTAPWVVCGGRACGGSSTANCMWLELVQLRNN